MKNVYLAIFLVLVVVLSAACLLSDDIGIKGFVEMLATKDFSVMQSAQ